MPLTLSPPESRLSGIIFFGLLALPPLIAIPYGGGDQWWMSLFQAFTFFLAALWSIDGAATGHWFTLSHLLAIPAAAFVLYVFLQSYIVSPDPYETRLAAAQFLALTTYGVLLLRYVNSERRLKALVLIVVIVGCASSMFGLARIGGQSGDAAFVLPALTRGQGFAQFLNKNHFAFLAEMSLGLLLGILAGRGVQRERRLAYFLFCLLLWAAVVLSNSRGGILAILCQIVFFVLTFGAIHDRGPNDEDVPGNRLLILIQHSIFIKIALAIMLLACISVGAVWLGGEPLADRIAHVNEEMTSPEQDQTDTSRVAIWRATLKMFRGHPIFGTGFGAYLDSITEYHQGNGNLIPYQAHNDYLELLAAGGIPAILLFFTFGAMLIRFAISRLTTGTMFERSACLGALVGLFAISVHSVFDFGLHITINAVVFVSLVVIATAVPKPAVIQKTMPSKH